MQQLVRHICGDTQVVDLVSLSPRTREEIVWRLRRFSCPACQRRNRYEAAHQFAEAAGLCPLQARFPQQIALAEIIRASIWRALLPPQADQLTRQMLAALFNRRSSASFWLALRGVATYRLDPAQVGCLLRCLLQGEGCETREAGKDRQHD